MLQFSMSGGTLACNVGTKENPGAACGKRCRSGGAERCLLGHVEQRCRGRSLLRNDAERWRLARIGIVAADFAICNYTQGFGDQTQVIGSPTTTTVYPASTVAFLPEDGGDLMLSTAQGYVTFRSSSPSWNWAYRERHHQLRIFGRFWSRTLRQWWRLRVAASPGVSPSQTAQRCSGALLQVVS